jgi:hypothetical protein
MNAKSTGIAAAVALAALAAGCGGSGRLSKAQYEQKIQTDGKAVQGAAGAITSSTGSLSKLAVNVAAAEKAAKAAADDLGSLKPPADIADDNAKIVTALRTIDAELTKLAQAAKAGNLTAVQQAGLALQSSPEIKTAEAAAKDMKAKGYKIGVIGSLTG